MRETNLLEMLSVILKAPDHIEAETIRYMKLEATWILTNVSFGAESDIDMMLHNQYGFINHFNLILEGNDY